MARFRCEIVPINIELGRYLNVPADQKFCHFCDNCIEDEVHTIVKCPMYTKVRTESFTRATYFNNDFIQMPDIDLIFLFSDKRVKYGL